MLLEGESVMTDWDWADHKAVGVLSVVTQQDEIRPVKEAWFWYAEHRHEQDAAGHTAVAEALREAYEAGREEQRREDAELVRQAWTAGDIETSVAMQPLELIRGARPAQAFTEEDVEAMRRAYKRYGGGARV